MSQTKSPSERRGRTPGVNTADHEQQNGPPSRTDTLKNLSSWQRGNAQSKVSICVMFMMVFKIDHFQIHRHTQLVLTVGGMAHFIFIKTPFTALRKDI